MTTHQVLTRHNLAIANSFIEDSIAAEAFEIDPKDEIFNLKLKA